MQAGGGGEATGPIIISPSTSKTTFFQRGFDEWAGSIDVVLEAGSIALKHAPSGLWSNFSTSESDDSNVIGFYTGDRAPDMSAWDVQAGIQKKWFAPGETAFWGGYAQVNDGWAPGSNGNGGNLGGIPADSILKPGTFVNIGVPVEITGSEVHLYAAYQHFNADLDLVTRDPAVSPQGKLKSVGESIDDFDVFYTGGRLYF